LALMQPVARQPAWAKSLFAGIAAWPECQHFWQSGIAGLSLSKTTRCQGGRHPAP
jgi:hypothetical protein